MVAEAKAVGHFLDAILDKTLHKTVGLLAGRGRRSWDVKFAGVQMPASQVHQMGRRVLIMSCDEHGEIRCGIRRINKKIVRKPSKVR
nr:RNA cytidine acetyltransferase 1-like [Tanacetum cinerariifolium]